MSHLIRVDTAGGVILEKAEEVEFHESGLWYGLRDSDGNSKWYSVFGVLRISEVDKAEYDRLESLSESKDDVPEAGNVAEDEAEAYRKYVMGLGKNQGGGIV